MCAQEKFIVDYFFVRKWLMIQYSVGFVIFPGGFGTIDELGDVITLIQTHQIDKAPLILMGKDYWFPLLQWMREYGFKEGLIVEKDLELVTISDNIYDTFDIIKTHCALCK